MRQLVGADAGGGGGGGGDAPPTAGPSSYTATQRALFELLERILGVRLDLEERILDRGMNSVSGASFISQCRRQ